MENLPGVQKFAGAIIVHARKPGGSTNPVPPLATHATLRRAVSVVVPCHNEEMNVHPLVNALRCHYDDYLHEIILVDDNSQDRTRSVIEELATHESSSCRARRRRESGVR
jgi:cellulose synthase/poly-beta-1,6-N-acetylglucosamine synthase-like glycosyltransferase